jgi:fumarate hydratase class II
LDDVMRDYRQESDSLGSIDVPAEAYWGAQTQRSLQNFDFPASEQMPLPIIYALAHIKAAAANIHRRHGLDNSIADAIIAAADDVIAGEFDAQFPLTIWQTGSGTQSNMNVNEVIAGIANDRLSGTRGGKSPVHPNDHVNKGQSSNDSFPTALHIACALAARDALLPALAQMQQDLEEKTRRWSAIIKIGRTHLQDATPMTLGQEFSGYAAQLDACRTRILSSLSHDIAPLAQGGTAVGTGLNAIADFGPAMAAALHERTGFPFTSADNKFAALAAHDGLMAFSGALSVLAAALMKIANDIRLLGSGPRAGLGELDLPANEPGSSIMPGKVNPTQCEMLTMIAAQVMGLHQTVTIGAMQGHMELNVFKPLIGANVLRSMDLLARGMDGFTRHLLHGLAPNEARIEELMQRSLMLVTALAPAIGYDQAAKIAKYAHEHGLSLKESAIKLQILDSEKFDTLVVPAHMIGPEPKAPVAN